MTMTTTLKPLPMAELPLRPEEGVPPPTLAEPLVVKVERLASLDVFRGITIATMLLVNNPASWRDIYGPLRHAEWHGWTMTDLVFPFFLFIVGVAIPFSMAKRTASGSRSRGEMLLTIWTRALSLVLLGLLLHSIPMWASPVVPPANAPPGPALPPGYTSLAVLRWVAACFVGISFFALLFPWRSRRLATIVPLAVALAFVILYWAIQLANRHALSAGLPENFNFGSGLLTPYKLRFPGVLQRIGVCYGFAATIALIAGRRTVLAAAVILMAAYAVVMLKVPYEGHVTGALEKTDNLARHVDEDVFGFSPTRNHNYSYPDPEGLVSTLPAIATVLLGILVGMRLRSDRPAAERGASVMAWGVVTTCLGVLLSWWLMPINKQIWTPSFTVFTAGMGMLALGAVFYAVDVRGRRRWAIPFTIYGMNAIAAFVLSGILNRLLSLVRFHHPRLKLPDGSTPLVTTPLDYAKTEIAYGLDQASTWLGEFGPRIGMAFPPIDTPNNVSLAYALAYVLLILLLMSVLYVSRIFIKV